MSLVATGDILLHKPLWDQAGRDAEASGQSGLDFGPMLTDVKTHVAGANLGLCHLETPLAPEDGPYRSYPLFSSPPQVVTAIKTTGYDACSTASNHTFDQGAAGVKRSLDTLDAAGIAHSGSARSPLEATRSTIVSTGGVRVGLLSYTYGFNGIDYPGGDTWRADLIDVADIKAAARQARQDGAQIVVLSLHWGTEYQQTINAQQKELAPQLAASPDIDVIIGHHAHVVQPIQKIGKTWVVYGLGNLISNSPGETGLEGLLTRFIFTETTDPVEASQRPFTVTKAEYLPVLSTRGSQVRVIDIPTALARNSYDGSTRARLERALDRTTQVVGSLGAFDDGMTPITAQ